MTGIDRPEENATKPGLRLDTAPSGYFVVLPSDDRNTTINLGRAWRALRASWIVIIGCGIAFGLSATAIAFVLENRYRSEIVVAPSEDSQLSAGGLRGQLGGLAALAGLDIGAMQSSKKDQALATLKSREFIAEFIQSRKLLPVLFPKSWDSRKSKWVNDVDAPTLQQGVDVFRKRVMSVTEDRRTGIITVAMESTDRQQTAAWANAIIDELNGRLRGNAIAEYRRSIEFLRTELGNTQLLSVQQAINQLIESQVHSAMLANVRRDYAFAVIDPAVVPAVDQRSWPNRPLLILLGLVSGVIVASGVSLFRRRTEWL
jgi:uncharacterized protein involved in exopolysaccharide biosynthesis